MKPPVKIRVCRSCAWDRKKLRRALRELAREHGERIVIRTKDCLDLCDRKPALRVDGKRLAPASVKKLRRAVDEAL